MTWGEWQASNGKQTHTLRLWTRPTASCGRVEPPSASGQHRSLFLTTIALRKPSSAWSAQTTLSSYSIRADKTIWLRQADLYYSKLLVQRRNNSPLSALVELQSLESASVTLVMLMVFFFRFDHVHLSSPGDCPVWKCTVWFGDGYILLNVCGSLYEQTDEINANERLSISELLTRESAEMWAAAGCSSAKSCTVCLTCRFDSFDACTSTFLLLFSLLYNANTFCFAHTDTTPSEWLNVNSSEWSLSSDVTAVVFFICFICDSKEKASHFLPLFFKLNCIIKACVCVRERKTKIQVVRLRGAC